MGRFGGKSCSSFRTTGAIRSDDPANERNDMFLTIEAAIEARLAPPLTLRSQVTFEPVRGAEPGRDRFFGDQGAYIEQLYLEYTRGSFTFRGGKFGQKLGVAWDAAPGIWSTDFAEDYELGEQIGIAADFNFGSEAMGRHVVTVGTFFADTTVLSESAFTNRGRTRRTDGGAGNTEDFSNVSISLEGGDIPALPGASYHLAYTNRDSDAAGETTESGVAGALRYAFKLGAVGVEPLVEYATFVDRDGVPGTDVDYLTTAVRFTCGKWNVALSRTGRRTRTEGALEADDSLAQATLGYAFESGINANAGYRHAEESGITTETLGFLVDYTLAF
ncbi:MAG: hypothetical protein GEU76_14480 [Alphaproteobacteria bacterium]|nr:hypothetical protein [Alphaproteobacteria bacterium]